jgi:hypothetical protein
MIAPIVLALVVLTVLMIVIAKTHQPRDSAHLSSETINKLQQIHREQQLFHLRSALYRNSEASCQQQMSSTSAPAVSSFRAPMVPASPSRSEPSAQASLRIARVSSLSQPRALVIGGKRSAGAAVEACGRVIRREAADNGPNAA